MSTKPLAREELWDVASTQLGFVNAQQAADLGVAKGALQMLVHRGTLTRAFRQVIWPHRRHEFWLHLV